MDRKNAEDLAEAIFDMIDRSHPRGLIKSELADLLVGFEHTSPGQADIRKAAEDAIIYGPGYIRSTVGDLGDFCILKKQKKRIEDRALGADLCDND